MAESRLALVIDGIEYRDWKSIQISRSLAQVAGEFNLTCGNRTAADISRLRIYNGASCVVTLDSEKLITGYVDEIEQGYSDTMSNLSIKGRDKTADLVDCSHDINTYKNEYLNSTISQIIQRLCAPFDIELKVDDPAIVSELAVVKDKISIDPGVKVFEVISNLCQQYAVLPVTTGDSKLWLTRAGTAVVYDKLEEGRNIKSANLVQSDRERYSIYRVKGQKSGGNTFRDKNDYFYEGVTADTTITRFRPLVIDASDYANSNDICQTRSDWESRVRLGASRQLQIVVNGWQQSNKYIWPINGLVDVKSPRIGINEVYGIYVRMLICSVDYSLDADGGELTTLSLAPPSTFDLIKRQDIKKKDEFRSAFQENKEKAALENQGLND